MYSGTVTFVLFVFFSVINFTGSSPVSDSHQFEDHSPIKNHQAYKRASPKLRFEGCYSDTDSGILQQAKSFNIEDNTNHGCVDKCAEEGLAISVTQGSICYCLMSSLPLPRMYDADDSKASGTDGPCSTTCPGTKAASLNIPCQGDECCGGPNSAYSVYLSGDIDVLKQLLRRVTESELKRLAYDYNQLTKDCVVTLPDGTKVSLGVCYNRYYQVSAYGTSTDNIGTQGLKSCTLKTELKDKKETYTCEDLQTLPAKHVQLEVLSMDKLIRSEESFDEELATSYDIVNDNTHGSTDQTLSKSYQLKTSFSTSWSTEFGFDIRITLGVETEVGAVFAKAKNTFQLSTGFSFSAGFKQTKGQDVSETFDVKTVAAPGTKVETRFFKSDMPVKINWRANIVVNGYVHIEDRAEWAVVKKSDPELGKVLTYDERKIFAFGTWDFGDRKTLIARSQAYDVNGNPISQPVDDTIQVD